MNIIITNILNIVVLKCVKTAKKKVTRIILYYTVKFNQGYTGFNDI